MDVVLSLLPDRATVGATTLRCARVGVGRRSRLKVLTATGDEVAYSAELICRVASKPAVGAAITVGDVSGAVSAVSVMDTTGPWMRHARVYVTTRTDVTGPLPDTVTFYPSESSTDAYRTTVRVPSATGVTVDARVEPASSSEDHSDGQRRAQVWTVTCDGDLLAQGIDAYATMRHGSVTYQLVGDPLVRVDPTGESWSRASLRRVGDGAA